MSDMDRAPRPRPLDLVARGGRLQTAMKRRAFTIKMLSQWTDISPGTIGHFLAGTRDMHLDDLKKLASALGVSASWIGYGE